MEEGVQSLTSMEALSRVGLTNPLKVPLRVPLRVASRVPIRVPLRVR